MPTPQPPTSPREADRRGRTRAPDINRFLDRRKDGWTRLESLLGRVEQSGMRSLSAAEAREFGALYRRASSDLVVARSRTANVRVLEYLNDLVARAYAQVYQQRRTRWSAPVEFLTRDFPRLFRRTWRANALAALVMVLGIVIGWELTRQDPASTAHLMPEQFARQMPGMREHWRGQAGHQTSRGLLEMMPLISSFIMTHNIAVGIMAFAGGMVGGVGTAVALLENGIMVGTLGQAMTTPSTWLTFWSLIIPHGVVELSAIAVMGGGGFLLAAAILAPGRRSRRQALLENGRDAVGLVGGAAALLVIAGFIEGFITPPDAIPREAKIAFGLFTGVLLTLYLTFAGRRGEPRTKGSLRAGAESRRLPG